MKTKSFGTPPAIAGTIAAVRAVSASIYLNPPSTVQAHALDRERMRNLQQIDFAVKAYYRNHRILPDRLDPVENRDSLSARSN